MATAAGLRRLLKWSGPFCSLHFDHLPPFLAMKLTTRPSNGPDTSQPPYKSLVVHLGEWEWPPQQGCGARAGLYGPVIGGSAECFVCGAGMFGSPETHRWSQNLLNVAGRSPKPPHGKWEHL